MHLSPLRVISSLLLGLTRLVSFALVLTACDQVATVGESEVRALDTNLGPLAGSSAGEWRWVGPRGPNPMPGDDRDIGMMCRDSSATGFGFRRGSTNRLLIFLMGGGACFNNTSCSNNPSSFSEESFFYDFVDGTTTKNGTTGVFSPHNPSNPFLNWTVIFVPYCTGDLHGGDTTNVRVSGVPEPQQFVGYRNMDRVLTILAANGASSASSIVLAGTSAGGFGTTNTYGLVADRLAPASVHLLNDSGPFLGADSVFSPEQEKLWRFLWKMESRRITPSVIPAGCTACTHDGLEHVLPYYAQKYPDHLFAFTSFTTDCVDRDLLCKNNPTCTEADLACEGPAGPRIDAQVYEDALFALRDSLLSNFATFYPAGNGHTFIQKMSFYDMKVDSLPLTDWIRRGLEGNAADVPAEPYSSR